MADERGWRPTGGGVRSRPGRGQAALALGLGRQAGAALEGILNGVWVEACWRGGAGLGLERNRRV